jgi:hypothetical protein
MEREQEKAAEEAEKKAAERTERARRVARLRAESTGREARYEDRRIRKARELEQQILAPRAPRAVSMEERRRMRQRDEDHRQRTFEAAQARLAAAQAAAPRPATPMTFPDVKSRLHDVTESLNSDNERFSLARKPERMVLGVSTAGLISRSVGNLSTDRSVRFRVGDKEGSG